MFKSFYESTHLGLWYPKGTGIKTVVYADSDHAGDYVNRNSTSGIYVALPPRDQRNQYLRFEGLQYTDDDIMDFETRLGKIYRREVHRVQVFNFRGLTDLIDKGLSSKMLMEHGDAQGKSVFVSQYWRRLFEIRGPLVHELILKFFSTIRFGEAMAESGRQIFDNGDLSAYWREISSEGDFLGTPPSYTLIRDLMRRLCHRLIACSIVGRSQALEKVTITDLFYLKRMDVGSVNIPYLFASTYAGTLATTCYPRTMPKRIARLEEEVQELRRSIMGLRGDVDRSITNQIRFATWMRYTRRRTSDASTSTAQQDELIFTYVYYDVMAFDLFMNDSYKTSSKFSTIQRGHRCKEIDNVGEVSII
uniref:Retrovirus-related Pol polyprotein from transposon TNT 1-94 n=1 Tax=Tanacetum cinerariifolium TaxID=118510 RepID=A0A6L2NZP5_TANCI|nr:retrovirus-related Pol polyprotein from transposon TNT 1-94 [Tanacetum cinerariifolium]